MTEVFHESHYDESTGGLVVSEISREEFSPQLISNRGSLSRAMERALASWAEEISPKERKRALWSRNKYVTPTNIFEQMGVAYTALEDDVVSNVAEMSEALAFQKVSFESDDKDHENVWNQIGRDLNLDWWLRAAWRELFTVSHFYGIRKWGWKTYRVQLEREKRKSRREMRLWVPTQLGFLDPTRVVPVQVDIFGNARYAWVASEADVRTYSKSLEGTQYDELVSQLFVGEYEPSSKEAQDLERLGASKAKLLLLNDEMVFSHSLTKTPFERWPRLRMKSIFPLLDLKHQLREMDRAWMLGGINFILLVKKGTDQRPAGAAELQDVTAQVRAQSSAPIIVSDHRLDIEIITPDQSHVLDADKWDVLDKRIMASLWGMFNFADAGRNDTALTVGRVIARGLSSRRHMLARTAEKQIIAATVDHPFNEDVFEGSYASLEFAPRRIELEFDAAIATLIQELRDRGDLSRETTLNEFNFDQDLEASRRKAEDERYKDVFSPVNVPFDSPDKTSPGGSSRTKRSGGKPAPENAPKVNNDE